MGKHKKQKRARKSSSSTGGGSISALCNVSGLAPNDDDADDILGCLAELDDGIGAHADSEAAGTDGDGSRVLNGTAARTTVDRTAQVNKVPTLTTQDVSPPPIRVELLRHKLMGELSSYLLGECKAGGLRMPSFERWCIDSKLEEREKRRAAAAAAAASAEGGKKRKRSRYADLDDSLNNDNKRSLLSSVIRSYHAHQM